MADLRRETVGKVEILFTYVGVDYVCPVEVKHLQKTMKRLARVCTCSSIETIHIEVVFYSLDMDSCLSANIRFMARRGQLSTIWSDTGANFVEAKIELKQFAPFGNLSRSCSFWRTL